MLYSATRLFNERERERVSLRPRTYANYALEKAAANLSYAFVIGLSWRVPHALTIDGSAMRVAKYVTAAEI